MLKPKSLLQYAIPIAVIVPIVAIAGSSNEWSESWAPRPISNLSSRLLQADLIERQDAGYYDKIGTSTYNVDYYVTNRNQYGTNIEGNFNIGTGGSASIASDSSTTSTTSIGAYNNTNNSVNIAGSQNSVDISSKADSTGNQDSGIRYQAGGSISTLGATTNKSN